MNKIRHGRALTLRHLLGSTAALSLVAAAGAAQAITIAGPETATTALDPVNLTGIGQMVINNGDGTVHLCTATLINPRTVVLAGSCMNVYPTTSYGAGTGGRAIGFAFSNNAVPALQNFITGGGAGPGRYLTNVAGGLYNSNFVVTHPLSTTPEGYLVLANLGMAALDTPATGVPTWAMLFSALPAPTTGAGYHVSLSGYGMGGTGVAGSNGISDFRRRIAENTLSVLTSYNRFYGFAYGSAPAAGRNQSQYFIDFDDPRRGTSSASIYDYNIIKDVAQPKEGMISSGDSGAPLILDRAYATPVVVGVNSTGFRFSGQANSGYGTIASFDPLYLNWEWIAANNPYHYVASRAGDANWTDTSHWTTTLDPNYRVLDANGNLVNGVPTVIGGGEANTGGQFGELCAPDVACQSQASAATPSAQTALPAATLANGLPGATGFAPNNFDGNRVNAVAPRYFDVTLSAAGTTTVNTAVTVDRLGFGGASAALSIDTAGSLTSLVDINQLTGAVQVNGALTSRGDYMMLSGRLGGTGTVTAPFFTNIAGALSPGTTGTTGALTFKGNIILSSGSGYLVDLGASGVSDRVVVKATTFSGGAPVDGKANIGGGLAFTLSPGLVPHAGDTYTLLSAEGGVTGTFNTPGAISAVLKPRLTYTANAVQMQIEAGKYTDVAGNSPMQRFYSKLLDENRGQSGARADLYESVDLMSAADVNATLDGLAPYAETLSLASARAAFNTATSFYRNRVASDFDPNAGGTLSITGRPLQSAEGLFESRGGPAPYSASFATDAVTVPNVLPQNVSGYVVAGYLDGDAAPAGFAAPGSRDPFDGLFFVGGVETSPGERSLLGGSVSYTDLSGVAAGAQTVDSKLLLGTVYTRHERDSGLVLSTQFSIGRLDSRTARTAVVGTTTYALSTRDPSLAYSAEAGLSKVVFDKGLEIAPRGSLRLSRIALNDVTETGGGPALTYSRDALSSAEARIGVAVTGTAHKITPYLTADVVHAFRSNPAVLSANLAGGAGASAVFDIAGVDTEWGEIGLGLKTDIERFTVSIAAEQTIDRSDVKTRSYTAALKFRF